MTARPTKAARLDGHCRRLLWLVALCLGGPLQALDPGRSPEDYVLDHWGISAGLPQVSVTSIAQDRDGYLWLSTQGGLARFDGHSFSSFGAADLAGYDPSLQDRVWSDVSGRLWLASPRGARWIERDQVVAIEGLGSPIGQVHSFADAPGGSVLIGSDRGLHAYSEGPAQPLGLTDVRVYSLLVDGQVVYAGSDEQVYSIRGGMAEALGADETLADVRFRQLTRVGDRIYAGSTRGLFELRGTDLVRPAWATSLAPLSIEGLGSDRDGNLWIGLLDGMLRYHPQLGLQRANASVDDVRAWVTAFYEDDEDNLWVGSYTTGLSRWRNGWALRIGAQRGLTDPFVWSVARGPDLQPWFGTATGLWRIDPEGRPLPVVSTLALPNSAVYNLFFDPAGHAWLGTRTGMALWDGSNLSQPELWAPLRQQQINAVLQQDPGRYWIGASGGLYWQDGGLLRRYTPDEGMPAVAVRGLLMLDGRIYVGSERGLYSGLDGRFRREGSNPLLDQALITALTVVGGNKLLIGTFDDGLFVLDVTGVTPIGLADGLPWLQVANLQVDQTHVWSSGPRGVYRFGLDELDALLRNGQALAPEPILNEARDARGGQRLRCCNGGATSRGLILNSRLWFPSLNGLVRIDPAGIRPERKPPKTVIEAVEADDGRRWLARPSLSLPEGLRDLTVRYTALSFRDPEGLRFRYRLQGFEPDWHSPGPQRTARYTNLAPGRYRFEVEVLSGGSEQARSTADIELIIPPRLFETLWFRSVLLLGMLLLAAWLVAWLRRRGQQRERHLQELVERRTEELRRVNDRLRSANQALAAESLTDGLTGLKNRRFLARYLGGWRRQQLLGEQASQERLWLFLIDLDHFKAINDRHGHLAGDELLCQFAQLLQRLAAEEGEALRWGGEEFLILLPATAVRSADEFADRIIRAVRRADFRANDHTPVPLTASVGVASFPALADRSDLVDWALAMELADTALYHSKLNGRDRWSRLQPSAEARYRDFGAGAGNQIEAVLQAGLARWEQSGQDRPSAAG